VGGEPGFVSRCPFQNGAVTGIMHKMVKRHVGFDRVVNVGDECRRRSRRRALPPIDWNRLNDNASEEKVGWSFLRMSRTDLP